MKKMCLSGIVILLSGATLGCVNSHGTYLSTGNRGYSLSCGGLATSWTSCLVKAGRLCGQRGYSIAYSDEINREMLVECKTQENQP